MIILLQPEKQTITLIYHSMNLTCAPNKFYFSISEKTLAKQIKNNHIKKTLSKAAVILSLQNTICIKVVHGTSSVTVHWESDYSKCIRKGQLA